MAKKSGPKNKVRKRRSKQHGKGRKGMKHGG